jgi:hypothetical protein
MLLADQLQKRPWPPFARKNLSHDITASSK